MSNAPQTWRPLWTSNPLRDFAQVQAEFEKLLTGLPGLRQHAPLTDFAPSCEVSETETHYTLKFDLPGIPKDQVKIELANNLLTVSAERKDERKKDTKTTHLSEISYGYFSRAFTLPKNVDPMNVDAKCENGVLTVTLPKKEVEKSKQITVQ